jgi:hypothetical protein
MPAAWLTYVGEKTVRVVGRRHGARASIHRSVATLLAHTPLNVFVSSIFASVIASLENPDGSITMVSDLPNEDRHHYGVWSVSKRVERTTGAAAPERPGSVRSARLTKRPARKLIRVFIDGRCAGQSWRAPAGWRRVWKAAELLLRQA